MGKNHSEKMEEKRTVIRDQGIKNTKFLEIMDKQQIEAQNATSAALFAKTESVRKFQETIASVVVWLSQSQPPAVPLQEKDPKFTDWDGGLTHLFFWLHRTILHFSWYGTYPRNAVALGPQRGLHRCYWRAAVPFSRWACTNGV